MTFDELLKKHGLERTGVSYGIQQKMKRYDRFVKEIESAKLKLSKTTKNITRVEIEAAITLGEENMGALNNEICAGIENYINNKDLNDRKAANLKKARESKGKEGVKPPEKKPEEKDSLFEVDGIASKIFNGDKITDKAEIDFYDENKGAIDAIVVKMKKDAEGIIEHQPVEKKKGNAGKIVAGIVTGLIIGGLALLGYRQYKNDKF